MSGVMKKVLLCIQLHNDKILNLTKELKKISVNVDTFYMDTYEIKANKYEKVILKCGVKRFKEKYIENRKTIFWQLVKCNNPNIILFVNLPDDIFSLRDVECMKEYSNAHNITMVTWIVDPLRANMDLIPYINKFNKVFSYEKRDVDWLQNIGIRAGFCPVGYNEAYNTAITEIEKNNKTIDILFIGTLYKNRINILNNLAKAAYKYNWNLVIYGPCYEHWWKKMLFKRKYPILFKYINNQMLTSQQCARLYRKAKVGLNIHVEGAEGLNPRSYEILATGTLEMLDARRYYYGIRPNVDCIVYKDCNELIEKCTRYINDDMARVKIIQNGMDYIKNMNMKEILKKVIEYE